ncbi:MAG: Na/Pi cotransporter family protein [Bacilli bacterium]|nr:Na/Pi cotransporter family protein [Bacilli bacterium]
MGYSTSFSLIVGGLGLFLFALFALSDEMKKITYSAKFKKVILSITNNKFESFFIGVLFTALIQSSSCSSILFLNLVESNMMTTLSCISAIIGANIGTCITAFLVSFSSISVSKIMPYLLFLFAFILILYKKKNVQQLCKILLLFNLIFFAILVIDVNVKNIFFVQEKSSILNFLNFLFSSSILGFLFGLVVTAIFQSSSIVIAILQVVCGTFGLHNVSFVNVFPIIIGANVGAIMPLLLMSINKTMAVKKITYINFFIKTMTAMFFMILLFLLGDVMKNMTINIDIMFQIALIHVLFNCFEALIFFPIIKKLDVLSTIFLEKIYKNKNN